MNPSLIDCCSLHIVQIVCESGYCHLGVVMIGDKNKDCTWYQEFYNETAGIRLAVTGVGEIAAAAIL